MKNFEIVFGNSCYHTMKNSNLENSNIIMIDIPFNVGDLSHITDYKITIPEELYIKSNTNSLKEITNTIIDNINKKNNIRVWTSHKDIYSYLMMLYISQIINKYNYNLSIIYSDEYNEKYSSPSIMSEEAIQDSQKLAHKLTSEELKTNANIWENLVTENAPLRVLENNHIKSVSLDYYDKDILETLAPLGKVQISKLVGKLMQKYYLQDTFYVYLINKLIQTNQIKIYKDTSIRHFENYIELN